MLYNSWNLCTSQIIVGSLDSISGKNSDEVIINLYNDGFSTRDIADYLQISHMTVYRKIKRLGLA